MMAATGTAAGMPVTAQVAAVNRDHAVLTTPCPGRDRAVPVTGPRRPRQTRPD